MLVKKQQLEACMEQLTISLNISINYKDVFNHIPLSLKLHCLQSEMLRQTFKMNFSDKEGYGTK